MHAKIIYSFKIYIMYILNHINNISYLSIVLLNILFKISILNNIFNKTIET